MKRILFPFLLLAFGNSYSQNIGINADGSAPETGVMLDIKGTNPKTTTLSETGFQIKSFNTSTNELKMRLILHGDAAGVSSRYAQIDAADYTSGTPTYVNLLLQPSGGNVGIGITNPGAKLTVSQSSNSYASGTLIYGNGINAQYLALSALAAGQASIQSGDNTTWQTLLLNPNGGNIGIGTTSPSTLVHIVGSSPRLGFTDLDAVLSAANPGWIVRAQDNGFFRIQNTPDFSSITDRMVIDATGNVGIGQSAPSTKLEVNGGNGTTLKIVDGNQATGKVLTSDASGVASWANPAAGTMVLLYNNETSVSGFTYANTTAFSYNVVGTFSQVKVEADIENDCSGGASTPAVGWSYSIVYNAVTKRTAKLLASSNDDEWLEGHVTYMGAVANGQTVKIDVINVGTAGNWYVRNFRVWGIY